ncbi:MAG: hypothetical protein IKA80_06390 [Spirochaetaceae bacterium]|nr:hypothetical protein [Spirochaetaceae bacterium]MBR2362257.1 hypothetical protein [Spirochaetaceae bacterium]
MFVPSGNFSWTDWELNVVQLLEEEFYKDRATGADGSDSGDAGSGVGK